MRRTLKQDLPRLLLTQRKRESRKGKKREKRNEINGLCVAWKQWRPFSTEAPVPSVPALQHSQSQQAALCGRCWTRVTPSMCPAALDDADRRPSPSSPFSPPAPPTSHAALLTARSLSFYSLTLRRLTCRGNIVSVPLLTIRAFFFLVASADGMMQQKKWSFNFTFQLQLCVDKS